ncbi:unnamed protein product, partial [Amoebophrya sp. A120]
VEHLIGKNRGGVFREKAETDAQAVRGGLLPRRTRGAGGNRAADLRVFAGTTGLHTEGTAAAHGPGFGIA